MALPNFDDISLFILVRQADEVVVKEVQEERVKLGIPADARRLRHEEDWAITYIEVHKKLKQALAELTTAEVLQLWERKTKKSKKRGRTHLPLYVRAYVLVRAGRQKKMAVYYSYVLPYLIEAGEIQMDDTGEPDPNQELEARNRFLKAMSRIESRRRRYSP